MYIVILVWDNPNGGKAVQVATDEGEPKQFESAEDARKAINPRFLADVVILDLETLETV